MRTIDLNADVGEGLDDEPLFDIVSSVNVACGAHAGDEQTMERAVSLAARKGIAVGAHPGYADPANFGRLEMRLAAAELAEMLVAQIHRLGRHASEHRTGIRHVKPHGAMYNQAASDPALAQTIATTLAQVHPGFRLVGLAGSRLVEAGVARGLRVAHEAFADRRYRADGTLAPRALDGALIEDPRDAVRQALALAQSTPVDTIDGGSITVRADTLCCHGDTPGAVEIARAVRAALEGESIRIAALP